jgi:hypothetical protein
MFTEERGIYVYIYIYIYRRLIHTQTHTHTHAKTHTHVCTRAHTVLQYRGERDVATYGSMLPTENHELDQLLLDFDARPASVDVEVLLQ